MGRWKKFKREVYRNRQRYLMFLPVLIFFLIFKYGPLYGASIAFMDYKPAKGILGSEWVGMKHFIKFIQDPYLFRLLRNTATLSCGSIIFGMPAAIILALSINEVRSFKFKRVIQTMTYLPHFISLVVVCGMLKQFLSANGILTHFFAMFGLQEKNLLMVPELYKPVHIASTIWQNMGWDSIIYLSALSAIDQQQYEAAELDGAGRFAKIRYITLPSLVPTISVLLIMKLGNIMNIGYEKIILLYNTVTLEKADVISSYVYRMGLASAYPQFSYTTAVGLFGSVINIILVVSGNKVVKALNGSGLW